MFIPWTKWSHIFIFEICLFSTGWKTMPSSPPSYQRPHYALDSLLDCGWNVINLKSVLQFEENRFSYDFQNYKIRFFSVFWRHPVFVLGAFFNSNAKILGTPHLFKKNKFLRWLSKDCQWTQKTSRCVCLLMFSASLRHCPEPYPRSVLHQQHIFTLAHHSGPHPGTTLQSQMDRTTLTQTWWCDGLVAMRPAWTVRFPNVLSQTTVAGENMSKICYFIMLLIIIIIDLYIVFQL